MVPVLFIVVKSEFQGKGVGKILMERLLKITKGKYGFIVLSVLKENKQAVNLFNEVGFRIFGERKGVCYMLNCFTIKGKILTIMVKIISKIHTK